MEIFQTKIVIKNRSFMVETSRLRHRNRKTRKPVFISQIWTTINLTNWNIFLTYFYHFNPVCRLTWYDGNMVLTSQFPVSRHFLQQKADLVVAPGRLGQAGSHRDPWVLEVLEVLGFRLLIVSSAHSHHQFLFEALITVGTVRGKLVISNAKVGSERPRENKMQNSQRILVTLILRS